MNDNELKLFKVETRGCGDFHVVSTDFNAAAQAVSDELDSQDYGYSNDWQHSAGDMDCNNSKNYDTQHQD